MKADYMFQIMMPVVKRSKWIGIYSLRRKNMCFTNFLPA